MKYQKHPISIAEQIAKLEARGLNFDDKQLAAKYLGNISYYRLRAYTYPYQNNVDPDSDHHFMRDDITFQDIIDLYVFDRRLRSLIFNELEKVEVAVRTKLSQIYSESTGDSHWYEDKSLYDSAAFAIQMDGDTLFDDISDDIVGDVDRSNEDFIKHYYNKYNEPDMPPSWMTMEVISFGTLSRLYKLLKTSNEKKAIANAFGIANVELFANWLHAFSGLRNCCAHHSRIWNRRFMVHIKMPYNTTYSFMSKADAVDIKQNKLFALLTALKYIVDIISPDNNFKNNLLHLLADNHRLLSLKEMGFPDNWKRLPVWQK
ncbi:MAG: Abi family protein [Paludibacteraceae bacterium]|nr:Abi family protein [Paludibacteraceae bacterium]